MTTFFATQFEKPENAARAYSLLLDLLAARGPAEANILRPADVLGLADACPDTLAPDDHIAKLGALLATAADQDLTPWSPALDLLALNWLAEGEHSYRYDPHSSIRPQVQWNPFGNMYYARPGMRRQPGRNPNIPKQNNNRPSPIPTGQLLEARPDDAWVAQLAADLRPKFDTLYAQLYLKANEPEEAFPYIEKLAAAHPDAGKNLAEEFVRVWSDNHDPNTDRNRTYRYGYMYGYNQRANSIPLTRSKQERNLKELASWVTRLRSLPIDDQAVLADAFTKVHSQAEVYKPEAITRVFGSFAAMRPDTVAALANTMRRNLASIWRDPKTQQKAKTKRKDKEILAEIDRGYSTAQDIVLAAIEKHPDAPGLWLARATLFLDHNNFLQQGGGGSDFVANRARAYEMFAKAAALYTAALPEDPADESTTLFEHWFYAGLGASDLGALNSTLQAAPAQFDAVRTALRAIPGAAAERHMARFANALAARISSVKPELKQRYLQHGLGIVGDHEKAAEARKVFDYYADLITEIQLVAKTDPPDGAVGSAEPFGLAVDIRHTKEIERESGGFGKYLTNQNNARYANNYGRPTQNYREKFEDTARAALAEHFQVLSVTFHDNKVRSRGTAREGWRTTPYAYLLLLPKNPEVDTVPPLQLDLDFLDTSGFVILPVATAALPIDARPARASAHHIENVKITQTLDERQAADGTLGLEIKALAHGLLPPLDTLLDVTPAGFELASGEGGELSVVQLQTESENPGPISERNWTLNQPATQDPRRHPPRRRHPLATQRLHRQARTPLLRPPPRRRTRPHRHRGRVGPQGGLINVQCSIINDQLSEPYLPSPKMLTYKSLSARFTKTDLLVVFGVAGAKLKLPPGVAIPGNAVASFGGGDSEVRLTDAIAGSARRVLLIGLGQRAAITPERLRRSAALAVKKAEKTGSRSATFWVAFPLGKIAEALGQALAEGAVMGAYHLADFQSGAKPAALKRVALHAEAAFATGARRGAITGAANCLTRRLQDTPANHMRPRDMVAEARKIARSCPAISLKVIDETAMARLGMGALRSVSLGSEEPAYLIHLTYKPTKKPAKKTAKKICLVGKGLTFDAGGISIKPSAKMDEMKYDMSGGAAVLGTFHALAALRPDVEVHGLVPTSENLPDGKANKPGDVVTAYNGLTIEVLNTDAEGRLILADALAYAADKIKPHAMIDLATLTGAVVVALGHELSGVMGNDQKLLDALVASGQTTGEGVWPLPILDYHKKDMRGTVGDLRNISSPGTGAGPSTAAAFLSNFVGAVPWAHLDIAGSAWGATGRDYQGGDVGTGVGVRLLLDYIENC